jgi:hypothetical protein
MFSYHLPAAYCLRNQVVLIQSCKDLHFSHLVSPSPIIIIGKSSVMQDVNILEMLPL